MYIGVVFAILFMISFVTESSCFPCLSCQSNKLQLLALVFVSTAIHDHQCWFTFTTPGNKHVLQVQNSFPVSKTSMILTIIIIMYTYTTLTFHCFPKISSAGQRRALLAQMITNALPQHCRQCC